jgi:hypothetical protein
MFERLNDAEAGHLIKAIYNYVKTGEDRPISNEATNMAYMFIKNQLSLDHEKWETTVEKRREAGRKSGEARKKEQNEQMPTSVQFVEQEGTQDICVEHNVNVTENVTVNENVNENEFSGSDEPPPKKPPKPRLRHREPENNTELVEKAYWTNWDMLYSQKMVSTEDPAVNWSKVRKLIKCHFKILKPEQLVDVINKALSDEWIMEKGYSIEKILASSYVNSVINKSRAVNVNQLAANTPLYKAALSCFETDGKTKALMYQDSYSENMQKQCLQEIIARCNNIAPDIPADFLRNVLEHFKSMCSGKYHGKWSFTPRCLRTSWVWELVIDSLPEPDNELTAGIRESIKGMFK